MAKAKKRNRPPLSRGETVGPSSKRNKTNKNPSSEQGLRVQEAGLAEEGQNGTPSADAKSASSERILKVSNREKRRLDKQHKSRSLLGQSRPRMDDGQGPADMPKMSTRGKDDHIQGADDLRRVRPHPVPSDLKLQLPELASLTAQYDVTVFQISTNAKLQSKIKALLNSLRVEEKKAPEGDTAANGHKDGKPRVAVLQARGNSSAAGKMISIVEISKREFLGTKLQETRNRKESSQEKARLDKSNPSLAKCRDNTWHQYTRLSSRLERWDGETAKTRRKRKLLELAGVGAAQGKQQGVENNLSSTATVPNTASATRPTDTKMDGEHDDDMAGATGIEDSLAHKSRPSDQSTTSDTRQGFVGGNDTPHQNADDPPPAGHGQSGPAQPIGGRGVSDEPESSGAGDLSGQDSRAVGAAVGSGDSADGSSYDDEDDAFERMEPIRAADRGDSMLGSSGSSRAKQQDLPGHSARPTGLANTELQLQEALQSGVKVRSVPVLSIIVSTCRVRQLESHLSR